MGWQWPEMKLLSVDLRGDNKAHPAPVFPTHVRPLMCHHTFRAQQLHKAALAWTVYIQQKVPVLNTWVLLLMLAHYWITEFVPKFLTEQSSTSQKLVPSGHLVRKNRCCEQT